MKIILLQNVPKLGQKNEIKEVSEGYAANMLFPRKLAKPATVSEIKNLKNREEIKNKKSEILHEKAFAILDKLNGREVIIKQKANEKGHLFAQVHLKEIADAIGTLGFDISEDWIMMEHPIKEIGDFPIKLGAYGKKAKISLKIAAS